MLMFNFKKNLSLLLSKNNKTANFFNLVHFSSPSSDSKTPNPSPQPNTISEFLINSCGLSSQRAATASKQIPKSTTVDQAHSVRHFFKHHGFNDTSVRKIISNSPGILNAHVDKTLRPNLKTLHEMGFGNDELQLLIASNPPLLVNPLAIPRLEFWQNFLGTNNREVLVSVLRRNRLLIGQDVVKGIAPKIALLKEHGLSQADIVGILRRGRGIIGLSLKSLEALLKRSKELGLHSQSSSMFARGISSLGRNNSGEFNAKMEVFKEIGWSEEEFLSALKKSPDIITFSDDNIKKKIKFLVDRGCCEPSYIASRPWLLTLSLEKRLMPRHYIMDILRANKLIGREYCLSSIMCLSDKRFADKIILPHMKQLPELHETYLAVCIGQIRI